MGSALRADWARGLKVDTVQTRPDIDILFWVGCAGSFDSRSQQVAAAFVKILNKAEVNFAILGEEESCCGDYARRTGNEYLFQDLAKKNIAALQKYNIDRIVTTCPHGYNTLKNEYPQLGGKFSVVHSSEFVLDLIESGKLVLPKSLDKTVGYHDPCYLGRHNGMYDAPRKILNSISGVTLVETENTRDRSFCCGAGGGHYWMESSGRRINDERTEQLLKTSPDMITTGCPYCLIMLDDGIESKELKGQVLVKDIIEVVSDSL
jgi:Fe-S oxidoreductase